MLPDSDALAQTTGSGNSPSRRKVLLILLGVLLVSHAPTLAAILVPKRLPSLCVAFSVLAVICYVALPLLAGRWWPEAAQFQRRWLPLRKADYFLVILLILVVFVWAGLGGWVLIRLGWSSPKDMLPFGNAGPVTAFVSLLTVVVLGPIAEEVLYRGYVQDQLAKVTRGPAAVILQAALFALYHIPVRGIDSLVVFGLGLILGFWRQWKRCLLPLILVHVLVNGVASIPPYLNVTGLNRAVEKAAASPKGREIARLAKTPAEVGIPAIALYLDDADNATQAVAMDALRKNYGKAGSRQYAEVLKTGTDGQVEGILLVIDYSHCKELIPEVRRVVYEHPTLGVQICALIALDGMGDTEGLTEIARDHPVEKVRKGASMMLRYKSQARD